MNARLLAFLGVFAALLSLSLGCRAQLVQGGSLPVTSGHAAAWVYNGILGDAGGAANPQTTSFGISAPGMPFCINDVPPPPGGTAPTGAFHQLCLGATATIGGTTGAFLTYNAYGGAAANSLYCQINGSIYPCLPSGGNVAGPTSPTPTAGDVACWNGGLTLRDSSSPCNMNVEPSYATAADTLNNLISNVVHPSLFGAKLDCSTNDTTALGAAFTYAATLPGFAAVDLGGKCAALGSTVTVSGSNVGIINGEVTHTSSFSCDTPALVFSGGAQHFVERVFIEGGGTSSQCMDGIETTGTNDWFLNNQIQHFPDYGIYLDRSGSSTGGTRVMGNNLVEFGPNDSQFPTQGDFTAKGIYVSGQDAQIAFNTSAYSQYPIYLASSGNGTYIGNHPYNGCGGVAGCARADPVDIYVDSNSPDNQFTSTYLDDGEFVLNNDSQVLRGLLFAGPVTGVCMTQRIQDIAQTASDVPSLHFNPPFIGGVNQPSGCSGSGSPVPILKMVATGGNSWSTNTTALNAATAETRVFGNTTSFIDENPSVGTVASFVGSNTSTGCIAVGMPSSTNDISLCTNGTNARINDDSGDTAFTIDDAGLYVHGNSPTCASGCGSGATIGGSNALGHVVFGTSPSTTVVVDLAAPVWTNAGAVDCIAQTPAASANVTALAISLTGTPTLTFTITSPISGQRLQWACLTED